MASKRKKKKKKSPEPGDVLSGKLSISALELIRMIHRVNPTGHGLDEKETTERYRLKSRLQSLLVRRFMDSLQVLPSDSKNSPVVSIKLKHFDEDACHAVLNELDDDARSWVQRHIDLQASNLLFTEHERPGSVKTKGSSGPDISDMPGQDNDRPDSIPADMSCDELIRVGQNALENYDYDACESCLTRAFETSNGGIEPATLLLEFYVDHVAAYEKALSLHELLSKDALKQDTVRVLLAIAAARVGQIDTALSYVERIHDSRSMDVYLSVGRHLIEQHKEEQARDILDKLNSFNRPDFEEAMNRFKADLRLLMTKRLKPLEEKIVIAEENGEKETAYDLAKTLLSEWPENTIAKKIKTEFENEIRGKKIEAFLIEANEARDAGNYQKEIVCLNKAIRTGADKERLADRIEHATHLAAKKQEELESSEVIDSWDTGARKEALLLYLKLNDRQRQAVKNRTGVQHFHWLDQAKCQQKTIKTEKTVTAVLELGNAAKALNQGENPDTVLEMLSPFAKSLQTVPDALSFIKKAESLSQSQAVKASRDKLLEAGCHLALGNLQKARTGLNRVNSTLLPSDDMSLFDRLMSTLDTKEKADRICQSYIQSAAKKEYFHCRSYCRQLAELEQHDKSGIWINQADHYSEAIKNQWSVVDYDLEGVPPSYILHGINTFEKRTNVCLMPDGIHMLFVIESSQWLFLNVFSMETQAFVKGWVFQPPKSLPFPKLVVSGETLWIVGGDGLLVEIHTDPFDIVSWHDFSDVIGKGNVLEHCWFFPKTRCLWMSIRNWSGENQETYEIVNLDQRRVVRSLKSNGVTNVINKGAESILFEQSIYTNMVNLFSETGKPIDSYTFDEFETVHDGTFHPNGKDHIFLSFDTSDEEDAFVLKMTIRPDDSKPRTPVTLPDSHGEYHHFSYTAFDEGLVFVHYQTDGNTGHKYCLSCFRPTQNDFQPFYQLQMDQNILLVSDESQNHLVAMCRYDNTLHSFRLTETKPDLPRLQPVIPSTNPLPYADNFIGCGHSTGDFDDMVSEYGSRFRTSVTSSAQFINEIKSKHGDNPEKLSAWRYVLEVNGLYSEAGDLLLWMSDTFPEHPRILYDQACSASKKKDWGRIADLLEDVDRQTLDDGSACHACHLLGIHYYLSGDIKKALTLWEEGASYDEGHCDLDSSITIARLSLMTPDERKQSDLKDEYLQTFQLYEAVDKSLLEENWQAVTELLEMNHYPPTGELQMLARYAEAFLQQSFKKGDMRWFCKMMVLACFCERLKRNDYFQKQRMFPSYIQIWPEERLQEIADRSDAWLLDVSGNS